MAGAVIGKGGHNIQKLRTEVCIGYNIQSSEKRKNLFFFWFLLSFYDLNDEKKKEILLKTSPHPVSLSTHIRNPFSLTLPPTTTSQ